MLFILSYVLGFILTPILLYLLEKKYPGSMQLKGQEEVAFTICSILWPFGLFAISILYFTYKVRQL